MNNKRKYVGVPTQEEIIEQFNQLNEITKGITTIEEILKFKEKYKSIAIEVNYDRLEEYQNETIECIRYEYKNILAYTYVEDGENKLNPYITVYSDDGEQFAQEKFDDYEKEYNRVYKMGCLELL